MARDSGPTGISGRDRRTLTSHETCRRIRRRTSSRSPEARSLLTVDGRHQAVQAIAEPVVDAEAWIIVVVVLGTLDTQATGENQPDGGERPHPCLHGGGTEADLGLFEEHRRARIVRDLSGVPQRAEDERRIRAAAGEEIALGELAEVTCR